MDSVRKYGTGVPVVSIPRSTRTWALGPNRENPRFASNALRQAPLKQTDAVFFAGETANVEHRPVVIIGSGPAGYQAAVYAARAHLRPVVLAGDAPGGQLMLTTKVENYLGFPDGGIDGMELMERSRKQAEDFGTEVRHESVSSVDFSRRPFVINTANEQTYLADSVIIATGASGRKLGVPNETELMGYGVSTCATCDGPFAEGQEAVVVGGGDSALEEAHHLTKFCTKVTLIHRRDAFRASKILQSRVLNNPKIDIRYDTEVEAILGDQIEGVTGVRLRDARTGEKQDFRTDRVFVAIGHVPNSQLFSEYLDLDPQGYIRVKGGTTETTIPGVYAAGDVMDPIFRQAIIAAGRGSEAAIRATHFLDAQKDAAPADGKHERDAGGEHPLLTLLKTWVKRWLG